MRRKIILIGLLLVVFMLPVNVDADFPWQSELNDDASCNDGLFNLYCRGIANRREVFIREGFSYTCGVSEIEFIFKYNLSEYEYFNESFWCGILQCELYLDGVRFGYVVQSVALFEDLKYVVTTTELSKGIHGIYFLCWTVYSTQVVYSDIEFGFTFKEEAYPWPAYVWLSLIFGIIGLGFGIFGIWLGWDNPRLVKLRGKLS